MRVIFVTGGNYWSSFYVILIKFKTAFTLYWLSVVFCIIYNDFLLSVLWIIITTECAFAINKFMILIWAQRGVKCDSFVVGLVWVITKKFTILRVLLLGIIVDEYWSTLWVKLNLLIIIHFTFQSIKPDKMSTNRSLRVVSFDNR